MRRSSTLNLALAWAAVAAVATGLASVPAFSHHAAPRIAAASVVAPVAAATPSASVVGTPRVTLSPSQTATAIVQAAKTTATVRATATASASSTPAARPTTNPPAATKVATKPAAPKPATDSPAPAPKPSGMYIQIGGWFKPIVVANLSQSAINACGPAVVWFGSLPGLGSGTTWLAGHNYCGFAFWDRLSIGTTLTIHDSAGTFTYRIVSRLHLDHQGGTAVGIKHDDLMLQTCTASGTSITYADLVS